MRSNGSSSAIRQRFQAALAKAVAELGGDRAAEEASGVSKSVWYDAKSGRAVPDERSTWPMMREVLTRIPAARTGVQDWDRLYQAVCAETGRPRRRDADRAIAPQHRPPTAAGDVNRPVPQQLPPGNGAFVGREAELAALDRALLAGSVGAVRIASVVGAPGVGKTALAVAWAHRAAGQFPDGVLYADLRGWGSDQPTAAVHLIPAWLRAFGMDPAAVPEDVDSRSAALRTVVAGKRVLMVLDNARSEEQVRPLLPGSPSCSVIVTGRHEMTGLTIHHGADIVRLDALTVEQSAALLRRIAGSAVDGSPDALAALIDLCDRLPLALHIVAENLRSRPGTALGALIAELADEQERLDRLGSDDPRSDLRTVFSWSCNLLPAEAAATFRLLGLFPGRTFDSHIAAALAGTTPQRAAGQLRTLKRAHLVQESVEGRLEMHDLLRLYARETVHRDGNDRAIRAARSRLFHYFLHNAQRANEFIAPHRYRLALPGGTRVPAPFHTYEQALRWLDIECETMVELCRRDDPALDQLRWRLAFMLKAYFFLTKRLHEWTASHQGALAAAVRAGERRGEAMTRSNLGLALHERGEDADALSHYLLAERLFAEEGDQHGVANSLAHQAVVHRRRGEFDRSLELNRRALEFHRRSESAISRRYVAITLRSIALAQLQTDRFAEAEEHLTEALGICDELGMQLDAARSWNTLGQIRLLSGRPSAAGEAYRAAVEAGRACGSTFEEALGWRGLGTVAEAAGDFDQAERYRHDAWRMLAALGSAKADEVLAESAFRRSDERDGSRAPSA